MARETGPVCRMCRREGIKLFLKGPRCDTPKCAYERRESPPGMSTFRRGKSTDYAIHLREKQKVKRYYGVFDRQFRNYFKQAERAKGNTGAALLTLLERRLDNVIYKLGFGQSRAASRQAVVHGHVYLNDRRMNIPSYLVKVGDKVSVKNSERSQTMIRQRLEELGEPHVQNWMTLDMVKLEAQIVAMPA
ncbi:hypothetical protein LCGC14_2892230, partial [marine sediment metagenome]